MKRWYWIVAALVSVGIAVTLLLTRAPYLDFALLLIADIEEIDLSAYERMLVISPHTDDELLGAGGLMQAAARQGLDVRVVIATNGDGHLLATLRDFRRLMPSGGDFVRLGFLRQQESLMGLRVVGVRPDRVHFLSYPDAGLSALWQNHWLATAPYYSPYSHTDSSPYPLTFNPTAVYAGADLRDDLHAILESQRPDLIVFPHPSDQHADHRSLSVFTRLAVAMMQHEDPSYQPEMLAYLVHYAGYPYPRKLRLDDRALPPPRLMEVTSDWVQVSLEPADVERKLTALRMHRSQYPTLRNLLESFARTNEIYARIPSAQVLPVLASG
jgi:LmbE family N-acetylglucosaminyl deacetylase